ncbi:MULTISPECIES: MFS transporter [Peribacillus]|uniref:MFS transporter n=1 Tax=Peribacillus TaxID=2675229 RepID=UPI0035C77BAC
MLMRAYFTFIPIYAEALGMTSITSYFFVIFALFIKLSRPFVGKLFDRKGANHIVYPFVLIFIIGMIILSQAHTMNAFLSAGAIIGEEFGVLQPAMQTLLFSQ